MYGLNKAMRPSGSSNTRMTWAVSITERAKSVSEQTDTFYCHGVFTADVPENLPLKSDRPLVWVDAATVASGNVHDRTGTTGERAPDAPVSPTARQVLTDLELVPFEGVS